MRSQISLLSFGAGERVNLQPSREGHGSEQMKHWANIKSQIMNVARAKDQRARQFAVVELRKLDTEKDRKGHQFIKYFLEEQMQYYHSRDELEAIGAREEMWYSNRCENDIGRIKRLCSIHKGFKTPETARKYIDFYWWKKRASRIVSEDLKYYL